METGLRGSQTVAPSPHLPLIAGFESTYAPLADVDCFESTGHGERWRNDLAAARAAGVLDLRYPCGGTGSEPGSYDWRETDVVLNHLHETGMRPILDLVHHTRAGPATCRPTAPRPPCVSRSPGTPRS